MGRNDYLGKALIDYEKLDHIIEQFANIKTVIEKPVAIEFVWPPSNPPSDSSRMI